MGKRSNGGPLIIRGSKRVCAISGAVFAPGYHFCPTENDILTYLRNKNMEQNLDLVDCVIKVIDVYEHLPGELLKKYLPTGEEALYFFCPVTKKYPSGLRVKRSTEAGNWRITGQDRKLYGMIMRILVFYDSEHKRTNWIMHEYRLEDKELSENEQKIEVVYVLCKLYEKNERNVRDSQQSGAYLRGREMEDFAHCDEIVIVPDSLIPKPCGLECLPNNTYVLDNCLQSSADNDNNTCNVIQNNHKSGSFGADILPNKPQSSQDMVLKDVKTRDNTGPSFLLKRTAEHEVNYDLCKPYQESEPNVKDMQHAEASFEAIEMKHFPGSPISELSGPETLTKNIAVLGESLQCSASNGDNTCDVIGSTDKATSCDVQSLPNRFQIYEDMAPNNIETSDIYDQSVDHDMTTDLGWKMHTEAWDCNIKIDPIDAFDDLNWGKLLSDICMDDIDWCNPSNVGNGSGTLMEDLSGGNRDGE